MEIYNKELVSRRNTNSKAKSLLNVKISDYACVLGFNMLLFESFIKSATGFTYIDEIVLICLCISFALSKNRTKQFENNQARSIKKSLIFLLLVCFCGFTGNAFTSVQTSIVPIAIDVVACIKFVLTLVFSLYLLCDMNHALDIVLKEIKLLIMLMLSFGFVNLFVDIGMGVDPRYGFRTSYMFIFGHPTNLVYASVGLVLLLCTDIKGNKVWIALALLIICLTLRAKGIGFAALVVLLLLSTEHGNRRITLAHVALSLLLCVAIGWDQISFYYTNAGFARNELTKTAIQIANQHFPIGAGFASYASNITASPQYYSPLYYTYGLSNVPGLQPGNTSFLSDTFWPILLGQFGWLGMIAFVCAISFLIYSLYMIARNAQSDLAIAVVLCFVYLLISSTSESAFFHPLSVYLAFCIGLAFSSLNSEGRTEQRAIENS